MGSVDLSIIKDIPGYKIIMKAVLKYQIQQLVEQLSDTTGEESILLTASVTDGSLSHLGSESGKSFLEGHEEIKSQFLGHVLKRYHSKKTEKQFVSGPGRKSATQQLVPLPYDDESEAAYFDAGYQTELQQETIPEPAITPSKSTGKTRRKAQKKASSPVEIKIRPKRSAAAMRSPFKSGMYAEEDYIEEMSDIEQELEEPGVDKTPVKYTEIVPVSDVNDNSLKTKGVDDGSGVVDVRGTIGETGNDSIGVVKNEPELVDEAVSDEEDPDWEPSTKKQRKSSGSRSVGSPVNVSGQGQVGVPHLQVDRTCSYCNKLFMSPSGMRQHERIHTGEKPYSCEICEKSFAQKSNLKSHMITHLQDS